MNEFTEEIEEPESPVYDAHFSTTPLPGAGRVDWEQVMKAHHDRYAKVKVERIITEDGEELVVPIEVPPKFSVTSSRMDVDPAKLPQSPKGILKMTTALGWEVLGIQETITHHEPVLMMNDGKKKKDGTQALKGDVKTAACDKTHIFITVANPTRQIGFQASWLDGRFEGVLMRDPLGFPREMFYDYSPSAERKKALGAKVATERAEGYGYDYNDGHSRLDKKRYTSVAGEFSEWLQDWLDLATEQKEEQHGTVGIE